MSEARSHQPYSINLPFSKDMCNKVELDGCMTPPAIRAVCCESRRVCDQSGSLVHNICGSSRSGWFSPAMDEVFIHVDLIGHLHNLNLTSVEILSFPQCLFTSPQGCVGIFKEVLRSVPRCRVVKLYPCKAVVGYGKYALWNVSANYPELEAGEKVGVHMMTHAGFETQLFVSWADLHRSVIRVWEECSESSADRFNLPKLVGMRACHR